MYASIFSANEIGNVKRKKITANDTLAHTYTVAVIAIESLKQKENLFYAFQLFHFHCS